MKRILSSSLTQFFVRQCEMLYPCFACYLNKLSDHDSEKSESDSEISEGGFPRLAEGSKNLLRLDDSAESPDKGHRIPSISGSVEGGEKLLGRDSSESSEGEKKGEDERSRTGRSVKKRPAHSRVLKWGKDLLHSSDEEENEASKKVKEVLEKKKE